MRKATIARKIATTLAIVVALYIIWAVFYFGPYVLENMNATKNRTNKTQIKVGQTKEEILSFMGKPKDPTRFSRDGEYEIIFFQSEPHIINWPSATINIGKAFPVIFKSNKAIGWGYPFYEEFIKKSNLFPGIKKMVNILDYIKKDAEKKRNKQ